jgi:predicted Zn-dependent peptidase
MANVSYAHAKSLNIPVVYYKLPNGLRVVISEDHIAPVVTVAVYYNVGFRVEPKGRTGFAHLFEHMMFQGSANVKKFEHAKFVEANGGNLNGHTDFDYTNYYETMPSNRVELGLWLESDRMRSLDISEENLKNQQAVVSEEVRVNVLNQPYQFFEWISLWENAFTNWNNAHNGYGDLAEINAATIEDVLNFFKTYYAPNNAVLTVVGDVDANEVKKMVEKHFAGIPSQPMPPRPDLPDEKSISALTPADLKAFVSKYFIPNAAHLIVVGDIDVDKTFAEIEKAFGSWKSGTVPADENPPVPQRDKRQIYFVNRPGSIQSAIYIGNVTIPRKDKEYFAIRTADTIFGGSFYSRLTRNIRESKGYTYSPFSSSNTRAKTGSMLTGAFVRNEVTGPTLLEMLYELDRMRVLPVTDEELSAAKEFSNGNFSVELASQFGLAGRIDTIYTYDLDKNFINDFRSKIDALTAADIQRAAAKYFDTYRAAIVIVGDWDKVKDQVTPFGEVTLYDAEGNLIK